MAVVWARETARDRSLEVEKENGGTATRSWLVRVDDPATTLSDIQDAAGVAIGDAHPDEGDLSCERISVRSSDDSGLLYVVSADYAPDAAGSSGGGGEGSGDDQSEVDGMYKQWSGSSSVASEPIYQDNNGNVMTNSAGDPLEGLEAEKAQFHLTLTTYYTSHADNLPLRGWVPLAREFTNAVNSDVWNGGQPRQWKCQGCSAKVVSDRLGPGGAVRFYWEVTWDFAFRADYWVLRPWDIGFNELVDDEGVPQPTYGISAGDESYIGDGSDGSGSGDDGPCDGNLQRRAIKGQDGKPVRQPVALQDGVAKAPCLRPSELWFEVYPEQEFTPTFGEVFTP